MFSKVGFESLAEDFAEKFSCNLTSSPIVNTCTFYAISSTLEAFRIGLEDSPWVFLCLLLLGH